MNRGGVTFFAASRRASKVDSSRRAPALRQHHEKVLGVAFAQNRVTHSQSFDECDIGPVHLLKRVGVVEIRLFPNDRVQLPLDQIGGNALQLRHARAIELAYIGKRFAGADDAVAPPFDGARSKLAREPVLFVPVK
jgi:hypothetical protein